MCVCGYDLQQYRSVMELSGCASFIYILGYYINACVYFLP